jgi:ribulose-phosphate 3-epimerase
MVHISASLLAANFARLGEDVHNAEKCGVDSFHFDMMDGHYVPNIALSPQHLLDLREYTQLPFHLHLELGNPDHVLDTFTELKAELILVQWDTIPEPGKTFDRINKRDSKIGLSLNPSVDLVEIKSYLKYIDTLLLLSVNPGFGGQPMVSGIKERVTLAADLILAEKANINLAVDGGVNLINSKDLIDAGADWLIIGTALFNQLDMASYIDAIKQNGM